MNFALGLAHNRFPATRVELGKALAGVDRRRPEEVLDRLRAVILQRQVSRGPHPIAWRHGEKDHRLMKGEMEGARPLMKAGGR